MGAEVRVLEGDPRLDLVVVGYGKLSMHGIDEVGHIFRFLAHDDGHAIDDDGLPDDDDDGLAVREYVFAGTEQSVWPASLESLRQALVSRRESHPFLADVPILVKLTDRSEDEIERGYYDDSPSLLLEGERLLVRVTHDIHKFEAEPDENAFRRLFEPFSDRHGASCREVVTDLREDHYFEAAPAYWSVDVTIDWPIEGRIVADAWEFGNEAQALLMAAGDGELTQENALDLLRGGRWDLFLEQPESEWLDAKEAPYRLNAKGEEGEQKKRELAKDVAAFANRPEGGVIVIGMKAEQEGDLEVIKKVKGINLSVFEGAETYRKVVARWVYPEVTGLEIETISGSSENKGLVVLHVPPQPPKSFPFLVQGVLPEGKLEGNYILLPRRRADETAVDDIGVIHARLRLGQQVLDRELPLSSDG